MLNKKIQCNSIQVRFVGERTFCLVFKYSNNLSIGHSGPFLKTGPKMQSKVINQSTVFGIQVIRKFEYRTLEHPVFRWIQNLDVQFSDLFSSYPKGS